LLVVNPFENSKQCTKPTKFVIQNKNISDHSENH